jgi:hypothetical protein
MHISSIWLCAKMGKSFDTSEKKEAVLKGQPFLCAKLNIIFKAIFLA